MIDLLNLIHYITKKNRIMMIFITFMITLVMIPVLISSLSHIQQESLLLINLINEKKDFILFAITILVFLASFVAIMTSYLNKGIGGKDIEKTSHILYKEIIKLNKRLSEIENKTSSGVSVEITESERNKLISDAKKRIIGNTLLLADNSLKSDISDFKKSYSLHKLHTDMILRLESEIDRLNRRGGLNLAIGTIIALTGILSLAYFLYSAPDIVDGVDFFIHHLPKLSFVIVVELFAYFFLRLYKNGFDEIKYFQNEIT
ncbi:hypothetical protein L3M36_002479, partial [Escherichia coli]|nr:hypothetical protein [Escherichia coli]